MPKTKAKNFYAVARGKSGEGIYRTWAECQEQVIGHKGARYKGFGTREECIDFIRENRHEDLQIIGTQIRSPIISTGHFTEQEDGQVSVPVIARRSHAIANRQRERATAPRRYYACTDNSVGPAILFDREQFNGHIPDSNNLHEFSTLNDAEDFIMERNPDYLLRRIENLEEENNKRQKQNIEQARQIELLQKLRI